MLFRLLQVQSCFVEIRALWRLVNLGLLAVSVAAMLVKCSPLDSLQDSLLFQYLRIHLHPNVNVLGQFRMPFTSSQARSIGLKYLFIYLFIFMQYRTGSHLLHLSIPSSPESNRYPIPPSSLDCPLKYWLCREGPFRSNGDSESVWASCPQHQWWCC